MKIWSYPSHIPTWSKLHVVVHRLGWTRGTESDHDVRILFSNRTLDKGGVILDRKGRRPGVSTVIRDKTINARCNDVTKLRTDVEFHRAFGYSSLVNPRKERSIEKTEVQATKEMREVPPGTKPRAGFVYQRPIDTRNKQGHYVDLRCNLVGHRIFRVFVKRKSRRFTGDGDARSEIVPPSHVFSREEIANIERMSELFGCDFADMDVLRDRKDGRIYVVDVNYTAHRHALDKIAEDHGKARRETYLQAYADLFRSNFDSPEWRVR